MIAAIMVSATAAGSFLVVRTGPRPLVHFGALVAAVGMVLLTRLGLESTYAADVLPALLVIGVGLGPVRGRGSRRRRAVPQRTARARP